MAGQVDDDGVGRRLELDVTADEDERSAGSECLGVGYEAGDTAVTVAREARVERRSRLSGVRVAAERKQLEIGMREDAIERLLAGKTRRAEDGDRLHLRIMQKSRIYADSEASRSRSSSTASS